MFLRRNLLACVVVGLTLSAALPNAAVAQMRGPASVASLAEELSPAVVNISTSRSVLGGGGMPFPDLPEGSPLEEFFDEHNPNYGLGDERMQEARSLGSGFIISADGLVVTNNHVIAGASAIEVFLNDGTRLPARTLGVDDKTDLAVLKVEAGRDLPFVSFGDSDKAVVGDWVMAIGNPFGLGGSVTLGIVSARNRDIQSGPYDQFIQTDAAINQGNSGGPLFDMEGKVVGINTAIIARGGQSLGIGFAVPGNLALPTIMQLAEFGETRRGWLGVGIQEVNDDIASSLGLPSTAGAMVIDVTPGGPSVGAIEQGDIIVEFDGKAIARMRDLPRVVAQTEVGKQVPVLVLRGGEQVKLDITLGRLEIGERLVAGNMPADAEPPMPQVPEPVDVPGARTLQDIVGFAVAPLDDGWRAEFGFTPEAEGIVVTDVNNGSDADRKGFIPGLIVTEVNQRRIGSVDQLNAMVDTAREAGRPAVLFKVEDPTGTSRFIAVRLG